MNRLSDKILEKIKEKKVKPKPRWYFILMHTVLLFAMVLSIIVGSIGIAIVIRHFSWTDWELAQRFSGGHVRSFFVLLPYLWLALIVLAVILADQLFKHTKRGYRFRPWLIILGSIVLSINFGYIFYLAKLDRPVEDVLKTKLPYYEAMEQKRNKLFAAPEMGVLAGEIKSIPSDQEWVIMDFRNHEWVVYIGEARFKQNFVPVEGLKVGLLGDLTPEDYFKARVITLWKMGLTMPPPPLQLKIEKR